MNNQRGSEQFTAVRNFFLCWRNPSHWHQMSSQRFPALSQALPWGGTGDKSLLQCHLLVSNLEPWMSFLLKLPARKSLIPNSSEIKTYQMLLNSLGIYLFEGKKGRTLWESLKNLTIPVHAMLFTFWWNGWIWFFLRI